MSNIALELLYAVVSKCIEIIRYSYYLLCCLPTCCFSGGVKLALNWKAINDSSRLRFPLEVLIMIKFNLYQLSCKFDLC